MKKMDLIQIIQGIFLMFLLSSTVVDSNVNLGSTRITVQFNEKLRIQAKINDGVVSKPKTAQACENGMVQLNCNNDYILVQSSQITLNNDKCPLKAKTLRCTKDQYQRKAFDLAVFCKNKRVCDIPVTSAIFGSQCKGDPRYVQIVYICSKYKFDENNALVLPKVVAPNVPSIIPIKDDKGIIKKNFCDTRTMSIDCHADKVISIVEGTYGRKNLRVCPTTKANVVCKGLDATNKLKKTCDGKRRCQLTVNQATFGNVCNNVNKYLNVKYKCVTPEVKKNPCEGNPCGFGATCRAVQGFPLCSCPTGTSGDPKERCCKKLTCSCYGDPHCTTFDKVNFNFQGICKYDLITTRCFNRTLPTGMVPFRVSQKHEYRNNRKTVSFVEFVEISVYGNTYRLRKKDQFDRHSVTVNGLLIPTTFTDKDTGLKIYLSGSDINFSTMFGLTITWNGRDRATYTLCNTYSNYVCGMCGNADGKPDNDFADRENNLRNKKNVLYKAAVYQWASKWRSPDNANTREYDGSRCNSAEEANKEPEPIKCKKEASYRKNEWCGIIKDTKGPWKNCLTKLPQNLIDSLYEGCLFDVCATEKNGTLQNRMRCQAYEELTSECGKVFLNATIMDWRIKTNCPKQCKENEVYGLKKECPKTCINPLGQTDCGLTWIREGCLCKDGYVLDSNGACVKKSECGCKLPDGSSVLTFGQTFSPDCITRLTCNKETGKLDVQTLPKCSENATCLPDLLGIPKCVCTDGFVGNGYQCNPVSVTTLKPTGFSLSSDILTSATSFLSTMTSSLTTLAPCFNKFIINGKPSEFANTPLRMTSQCGLSDEPFSYYEIKDVEFNECINEKFCYGFGDPHYTTFDGYKFPIDRNCTYVLATDFCSGNKKAKYIIYVDHERRYSNPNANYMRAIQIFYNGKFYEITKDFKINRVITAVPYSSAKDNVFVSREGNYIVFKTNSFSVYFDGDQLLKFSQCGEPVCGLCGNQNGKIADDNFNRNMYIVQNRRRGCLP